ncbi:nucleoredoxin-like protein 1 [Lycorma delicatula]|uniref:nucleoredoxin-like protein 1 n=1 Tax=Lycorma delicatula TaxID=130591 RepID=UPI003F517170
MMNSFRRAPGNWFGIDYDEDIRLVLAYTYGILGVPQIIVINSFGDTITRRGVEEIQDLGVSALLTWM